MKIAVTACSGRLGHATLKALCEQMNVADVIGIARSPEKIGIPGIGKRAAAYESPDDMAEALDGVDTAILISAPTETGSDRVGLHASVIDAAIRAGIRKLIFTSVIGDAAAPGSLFYPSQKVLRDTEALVQQSGLEWIIARNGLYLDLDLIQIRQADEAGVYRNNGGDGKCGYISITELGFALAQLARSDACNGQVVNLTGESLSQAELISMANAVFGVNVTYEVVTAQQTMDKFAAKAAFAARGEEVIKMLAGCFECMESGKFDVPSHFSQAAGRPAPSTRQMMEDILAAQA